MPGGFPRLASLSDIEAVEATPLADRIAAPDVFGVLKAAAERHADRLALIDIKEPANPSSDRRWTYKQAFAEMTRTANALWKAGGGRPVGYLLPNLAETHFVLCAAAAGAAAGATFPAGIPTLGALALCAYRCYGKGCNHRDMHVASRTESRPTTKQTRVLMLQSRQDRSWARMAVSET